MLHTLSSVCYLQTFWRQPFWLVWGDTTFLFNYVPFVYFCFYFIFCLRQITKKYCCNLCQSVFCLCSLLTIYHFEFIFVYGVRKCSNLIVLHVAVQIFQHHLLKGLSFLHCMFLSSLLKTNHICVGLFLGSLFCSIDLCASTMLFQLL